jgi:nucleoredoxin
MKIIAGFQFRLLIAAALLGMAASYLHAGTVTDAVKGNLFVYREKALQPFDETKLAGVKYFALYYSAHWCPPCRAFTPQLVQFYNREKKQHPEFELFFFRNDKSQDDMIEYMKLMKMQWPAVGFQKDGPLLKYRGSGIPCLVVVDVDGKVLADSFENGNYIGPEKPMKELGRMLAKNKQSTTGSSSSDFDSFFKKNPTN